VDGSGNIQYYLQDQLGSTRGLIDSSGNLAGQYTFNPYGDVRGHAGVSTPFAYAGQYTDSESGLQYLQARYYDPPTAQFLTVDPLASVTRQTYGYAVGDPLTGSDPSGLACAIGFVPLPCPSDVATFAGQVFASATGLTPAYAPPATDTAGFLNTAPTSFTTPASDATASMLLLLSPGGWEEDALAEGNFVYRGLAEGEDAPCEFGLTARDPQATNDPLSHVAGRQRSQWISTTKSLDVAQTRYGRHGVVRIDLSRVPGRVVDLSNGIPGVPRHYMLSRWAAKQQEVLIQGRVPPGAISRVP
jgi:RHS repeat-associated protein